MVFISFPAMFVVSALDHRFGWSPVPASVSVIGDVLVAVGLGLAMLVIVQNSYAAANVTVEAGQQLVSTGLYGLVRHPMYTGNVVLMLGIPLALGSYWGLLLVIPGVVVLILRIRDEEDLLTHELSGYRLHPTGALSAAALRVVNLSRNRSSGCEIGRRPGFCFASGEP